MMMSQFLFRPDAVILANGVFPTHAIPLGVLRSAPHVVCCDGSIIHWPDADVVVGDGDSIPSQYRSRLARITEQEDNDLTKATRYCLDHYHSSISNHSRLRLAYLGATGMREDHTLGNIALMMRYYRQMNIEPLMLTDYGWFVAAEGRQTFDSFAGQQVSIFSFNTTRLTSEGLRWSAYSYEELWQGTLNESLGARFTLDADGCYLVYRTYDAK